jgi:hypothetical protein
MSDMCLAHDREDFIFREDFMHLRGTNLTSKSKSSGSCRLPLSGSSPVRGYVSEFHEDPAVQLTSYPGTVRQFVVTGLASEQPFGVGVLLGWVNIAFG